MTPHDAMEDLIEPVIDQSLAIVMRRASDGDVAHGIVAALRRVRTAIDDVGGAAMTGTLDAAIRDRLIVRKMRMNRAGEAIHRGVLPPAGAGAAMSETVLMNTADACLIYSARRNDTTDLLLTIFVLVDRLIETLRGAPDYGDLIQWLRSDEEAAVQAADNVFDGPAASIH
jgi:hypothetical protein